MRSAAASGGEASFLPKKRALVAGASDAGTLVRHGADGRGGRQKVLCPANGAALQARRLSPSDRGQNFWRGFDR